MHFRIILQAVTTVVAIGVSSAFAAPTCPIGQGPRADAKSNKLFLLFPAEKVSNPTVFPATGFDTRVSWLPLEFNISDLQNYTSGTADELFDTVYDVVTDIYCEFNVQVVKTVRPPSNADGLRRNTIGIGSDASERDARWYDPIMKFLRIGCRPRWGQSARRGGDVHDATAVDFGRVWAGTFQACATGRWGPLRKAQTRAWADGIGSTAAHEAAHNYGVGGVEHADGLPHARGEDAYYRHLMRETESYYLSDLTKPRHFSDHEYSLLAKNVGVAMDILWNWDFINPDRSTGVKLRISFLSAESALTLSGAYTGSNSPWASPSLRGPLGTTSFKGTTYNRYEIEWSTGQPWSGGPTGQVPARAKFHVGATLAEVNQTAPDAIIITDVTLFDASDHPLQQRPRWAGYRRGVRW